jgi:hypothetical protein
MPPPQQGDPPLILRIPPCPQQGTKRTAPEGGIADSDQRRPPPPGSATTKSPAQRIDLLPLLHNIPVDEGPAAIALKAAARVLDDHADGFTKTLASKETLTLQHWLGLVTDLIRAAVEPLTTGKGWDEDAEHLHMERMLCTSVQEILNESCCFNELQIAPDDIPMDDDEPVLNPSQPPNTQTEPLSTNPSNAVDPILSALIDIKRSFTGINSRLSRLETQSERQQPRAPQNQGKQSAKTSYADAASRKPPSQPTPTPPPPPIAQPPSVRLVIRYQGQPPQQRTYPKVIVEEVNKHLMAVPSAQAANLRVLGASWNNSGNCILTFPPGTPPRSAVNHIPTIREALSLDQSTIISRDVPWSKVTLAGVHAREHPLSPEIFSESMLLETLKENPVVKKLTITQGPSWVRPKDQIEGLKSSISFEFEDPDGASLKSLLKARDLFMFGSPCKIKKWIDKPRLRQCTDCWGLGHVARACKRKSKVRVRCCCCGGSHSESNHRHECKKCENIPESQPCTHFHCVNCKEEHAADDPSCPSRRLYKMPISVLSHSSQPNNEEVMTQ